MILFLFLLLVSCAGLKKANEFYENKNYELAIKECQQAVEKDSLNAEAYFIMGKSYRALNKIERAIASLQTAYQIRPGSTITEDAKKELINTKLFKASQALKEKSYNVAFSQYKEVLELDSTNFRANFNLGVAYEENRWLGKAKYYFQKALKINFEDESIPQKLAAIDSLTNLADKNYEKGKKYYNQRKISSAARYLNLALKYKDDFKDARYYSNMARGKILYKRGKKGQVWKAIGLYGEAMMLRPESAEPHYFLAKAYEKKDRNEFDNAINEYKICIEKEPDGSFARVSRKKIKELTTRRNKLKKFWGK